MSPSPAVEPRIAVLLACHNRRDTTLACLHALFACDLPASVGVNVLLVDDGSSDGTTDAVRAAFPSVRILAGDGSLFWNGAMSMAFSDARKAGYSHYLWLNDDTVLRPDALRRLFTVSAEFGDRTIVVGSTVDAATGVHTYGGICQSKLVRSRFSLIPISESVPKDCDTFTGNCVLIPEPVAKVIGGIDSSYTHGFGDYDYGLRARQGGLRAVVAPGVIGTCSWNKIDNTFRDPRFTRWAKLKLMIGPKGLPFNEWKLFARRHMGILWPLYWLWPYFRVVALGK